MTSDAPDLLYVHTVSLPGPAANTVQVAKMCDAFLRSGAKTTLVVPEPRYRDARPQPDRARKIAQAYGLAAVPHVVGGFFPKLPAKQLLFGASACLKYGKRGKTLVYTRSISVAYMAARLGYRVSLEMHGPLFDRKATDLKRFAWIVKSPRFAGLVVISQSIATWFQDAFPDLKGRILVAHDGADEAPTGITPKDLSGGFRVGYTGHLYSGKGMELIAQVAPLCPEAQFHIVGGRDEDISHWKDTLAQQQTGDNITFHGHQPHADIPSYLAAMDVVVAPYLRSVSGVGGGRQNLADWMSPLKLFEYMSMGKPILCSDLPVLREVLRQDDTALLADPDRPRDWVQALRTLQADPDHRQRLARNALADFLARYTWDKRADAILRFVTPAGTGDAS